MSIEKKVPFKVEAALRDLDVTDAEEVAVREDKATYYKTDTGKVVRTYVVDNGDGTFSWKLEEVS